MIDDVNDSNNGRVHFKTYKHKKTNVHLVADCRKIENNNQQNMYVYV